ncbi:GNAT family N-acetyltransferase, partial [Halomonas sp. SIMBA_159]
YLHDMAVSQNARGLGLASRLLNYAEQYAIELGFSRLALVAVQGSVPYWQKRGFVVVNLSSSEATRALASYSGQHAMYMQKS